MKTRLLIIFLLLSTLLSGCSQGDIYSCRKIIRAGGLNGPSWVYDEREFHKPILLIVKGKELYSYYSDFKYKTHKDSTEDLVVGSKTKGGVTNYWRLNTVDKIASWGYGNRGDEMFRCENK